MPHVDNKSRRGDHDALEGSHVKVLEGEHAGQIGAYVKTLLRDEDGWPTLIQVRFEDTTYKAALASEPYHNVVTVRQHLVL